MKRICKTVNSVLLACAVAVSSLGGIAYADAGQKNEGGYDQYSSDNQTEISLADDTLSEDDAALLAEIEGIAAKTNVGEKDESYTDNINIYMNWGTVSPLYSLLNVYADIDAAKAEGKEPTKSFMWYERATTADEKLLPDNVTLMNVIDTKYNNGANNAENTKQCMGFVRKVYETYPNAHYTLFTDDLRAQYEFLLMNYNGIPKEQYNVILGTDGTATYSMIKNYLYKDSDPNDVDSTMEDVNSNWDWYAYWYHEYQKRISNHQVDQGRFLNNNGGASFVMWEQASQDNVEYWIQWPQLMVSDVEGLNEIMQDRMNIVEKHHNDMFADLSEESKKDFLNLVLGGAFKTAGYPEGTDYKAMYDQTYMPKYAEGGKYMIISGTAPAGENGMFEKSVNAVIDHFGDEYTYLYKPHPAWPASTIPGRAEFLESKGIVELPAQTPMEVLLWTYPNVNVGGYNSSLYMSATTPGQVKFFLASGPDVLTTPLPDLYNLGYFDDAVFFNPDLVIPTTVPTTEPTTVPTTEPTTVPTTEPTTVPTTEPTTAPTTESTTVPTTEPTTVPTTEPTTVPTTVPTTKPTTVPTTEPTTVPTTEPTTAPTTEPTTVPTTDPTTVPTTEPTTGPTTVPSIEPTTVPTTEPTTAPSIEPSTTPTVAPTTTPTPGMSYPAAHSSGGSSRPKTTPKATSTPNATSAPEVTDKPETIPTTEPQSTTEPENTPAASTARFTDVHEGDWFYNDVEYALENGLMNGVSDTEFAPNGDITRGMFVTILYRMDGEPDAQANGFTDVPADAYYADAVAWANANGIVSGYSESEFKPDSNITREQMAAILYRYASYKGIDTSVGGEAMSYTDAADVSEYAVQAMQWACGAGMINGTDDKLEPQSTATRAQAAAVFGRFDKKY